MHFSNQHSLLPLQHVSSTLKNLRTKYNDKPWDMGRPIYACLKISAIKRNLFLLKEKLSEFPRVPRVWATVKSNAYGHGIVRILPALENADGLAVLDLQEAFLCRDSGWKKPIMVYGGAYSQEEIPLLLDIPNIHLVISHLAQLSWLKNYLTYSSSCTLWLRYHGDTHHYGFNEIEYQIAYKYANKLLSNDLINGIGHFNHYACSDNMHSIDKCANIFRELIKKFPGETSTGNSAILLNHSEYCRDIDWVRPGLALYGASPISTKTAKNFGLEPAMSLHSELINIRKISAGDKIGYGATFVAPTDMRIGLISCGYGDGYPRNAATGTPIIVGSKKTRLLGRVSMDISVVDLSTTPEAEIGMPVTLWGTHDLPAEEVAAASGTIAAELFTRLSPNVNVFTIT